MAIAFEISPTDFGLSLRVRMRFNLLLVAKVSKNALQDAFFM